MKSLLPVLSGIKVDVKRGLRCKSKKNSGADHALQTVTAKLCGYKSIYQTTAVKTPKTLKHKGIEFLEKSTHYDNMSSIDVESVWQANAKIIAPSLPDNPTVMLDLTPNSLEGNYEAKRKGYTGRKNGEPVTGYCQQIASAFFVALKKAGYALRLPGNYNSFSNPTKHGDNKLPCLNFNEKAANHVVNKMHALYPGKHFTWLFDRGFDEHAFLFELIKLGDDFVTALDKNAECVKSIQRTIDSGSIVLKKTDLFEYYQTIVKIEKTTLEAVYIKPLDNTPAYWLITNKKNISGPELKKMYNQRSGEEPLFDYLKNDYNAKKPCNKKFSGAQVHLALLCLAHNIISNLSQQILGAYLRLYTLTATLTEYTTLHFLFEPEQKNKPKTTRRSKQPSPRQQQK